MLDITFSYFFEFFQFFFAERCPSEIRIKRIPSDIILEIIMFCTSDIDCHILYIIKRMKSLSDRSPIFVIYLAFQ